MQLEVLVWEVINPYTCDGAMSTMRRPIGIHRVKRACTAQRSACPTDECHHDNHGQSGAVAPGRRRRRRGVAVGHRECRIVFHINIGSMPTQCVKRLMLTDQSVPSPTPARLGPTGPRARTEHDTHGAARTASTARERERPVCDQFRIVSANSQGLERAPSRPFASHRQNWSGKSRLPLTCTAAAAACTVLIVERQRHSTSACRHLPASARNAHRCA